ncbi:MAG: DUF2164 family protein [Endomicrobium sp.]|nr:DUF2164 family protein [Endomicrobium sp.]MDR2645025.1 DUF2164 family protein [Endomicrobium sp.]
MGVLKSELFIDFISKNIAPCYYNKALSDSIVLIKDRMEPAMPTMVLTLVVSSHHKLNHTLSALIILFTTVSAFITLPLTSWLTRNF